MVMLWLPTKRFSFRQNHCLKNTLHTHFKFSVCVYMGMAPVPIVLWPWPSNVKINSGCENFGHFFTFWPCSDKQRDRLPYD